MSYLWSSGTLVTMWSRITDLESSRELTGRRQGKHVGEGVRPSAPARPCCPVSLPHNMPVAAAAVTADFVGVDAVYRRQHCTP